MVRKTADRPVCVSVTVCMCLSVCVVSDENSTMKITKQLCVGCYEAQLHIGYVSHHSKLLATQSDSCFNPTNKQTDTLGWEAADAQCSLYSSQSTGMYDIVIHKLWYVAHRFREFTLQEMMWGHRPVSSSTLILFSVCDATFEENTPELYIYIFLFCPTPLFV